MEAAPAGYRIGEHFSATGTGRSTEAASAAQATFGSGSESDSARAFARAKAGVHDCGSKCNWVQGGAAAGDGGDGGDGGGGGGGGGGGAHTLSSSAASSSASIPEPDSAFAATYTVARPVTTAQPHWGVAHTDAAARQAVAGEAHSAEALRAAAESAAAARPLEVELAQARTDTLRDALVGSKGLLKAYDVRTYTAEEQLAERAEIILTLNAKADALAASIANIKQDCNRKVDAIEYAAANRVKAAEAYAANRIETAGENPP